MHTNKRSFHLWLPNVYEFKGGIQVYLSSFLKALYNLYPQNIYHLFFKHDTHKPSGEDRWETAHFHFTGRWPLAVRTLVFAIKIAVFGIIKRPSIIIAAHLNFAVVAYWLNRLFGTEYWIIVYGIDVWNTERTALISALGQAERILAVSNYTKRRLIEEQSLDPEKISLLPCAFDANRFEVGPKSVHLLEKYGLSAQQSVILTVARLADVDRFKGYDQMLAALPEIRRAIPDIHYIIVGKGEDRTRIEQLVLERGLEDCVTLAGFVPDTELSDYYNLCNVFAMPSKLEGFGIVYLEAMACGKPAVGGNQDGAVDALDSGNLGALVDPDDISQIADTVITIIRKEYPLPLLYQPHQLRQAVIDLYGYQAFQGRLHNLLKSVCE